MANLDANIKYAFREFKKDHMVVITFCSLCLAGFFCFMWVKSTSKTYDIVETKIEVYKLNDTEQDSIIRTIMANNARLETIIEMTEKLKK